MSKLSAKVKLKRAGDQLSIQVVEFSSSDISTRLAGFTDLDWRAGVEQIAVDLDYDGETFRPDIIDRPAAEVDYVKASYEAGFDQVGEHVAIKITDILGGEEIFTQSVEL